MKTGNRVGVAYWFCAAITLFNAMASASYSLMSLRMAGENEYAMYGASRGVALLLTVVYAMIRRSRNGMTTIAIAIILVEAFDAVVGWQLHVPARTYAPAVFAALNFALLLWMNRTPSALPPK